jgi:hypothetical protein
VSALLLVLAVDETAIEIINYYVKNVFQQDYFGDFPESLHKPESPKVTYAVGSMEWQAEQQQKEISRIEAEARREKRRLARVAMIMRAKSLNARSGEIARSSAGDSAHMGDPARAHCGSAPPG